MDELADKAQIAWLKESMDLTAREFELLEFETLGHMGPVTDAEMVDAAIAAFLDRVVGARRPEREEITAHG